MQNAANLNANQAKVMVCFCKPNRMNNLALA